MCIFLLKLSIFVKLHPYLYLINEKDLQKLDVIFLLDLRI